MAPARHVPHARRYRAMNDMNGSGSTVLLVEADADERDRFDRQRVIQIEHEFIDRTRNERPRRQNAFD